ncbi:hypothetical protein BGZ57DRAFT_998388, partial [Hyaloscypha finlandica]
TRSTSTAWKWRRNRLCITSLSRAVPIVDYGTTIVCCVYSFVQSVSHLRRPALL